MRGETVTRDASETARLHAELAECREEWDAALRRAEEAEGRAVDSERRAGEAEAARRTLHALMEYIAEGITIADAPDVNIRMVSRYGQQITGRSPEAIEGIPVEEHVEKWDIYHADGKTRARGEELPLTRATRQGEVVIDEEWVLRRADGKAVPILINAGPIRNERGEITGGVIAWRDITHRKQAEEDVLRLTQDLECQVRARTAELRVVEERLRLATESTGFGTFDFFPQTGELIWSAHAKEHFGLSPDAHVDYEVFLRGLHPADRERVDRIVQAALRGETMRVTQEFGDPQRARRVYDLRFYPLRDAAGNIVGAGEIASDVTDRVRAEEALRESEERLRKALSIETVGVLFFSLDGHIREANAALERISGYSSEDLRTTPWRALTPPEFQDVTARTAEELATRGKAAPYENQWFRKDGSRFWGLFAPTRLSGSGPDSEC